jgi:hypothetical protein
MRMPRRTAKRPSSSDGWSVQFPARSVDAHRAHLDVMRLRVADDLRRRVETHRLRIQQRGAEDIGMPALHPIARIGDQRKGGGVAFRESVTAEAFELPEGLLGELLLIAISDHAGDKLVSKREPPPVNLKVAMLLRS